VQDAGKFKGEVNVIKDCTRSTCKQPETNQHQHEFDDYHFSILSFGRNTVARIVSASRVQPALLVLYGE
jgi:hypothetical protein